jgi:hypothetical protein
MKMVSPSQKKSDFSAQQTQASLQGLQQDLNPMLNPKVAEAKRVAMMMMEETGMSAQEIKELGNAAELAIYNRSLYPMFLEKVRELGQDDDRVFGPTINYGVLAVLATAAKLV